MAECAIPDCGKPARKRGCCHVHYYRWRIHGDPLGGGPSRGHQGETCTVDGCESEPHARGVCNMHYRRWLTHGDPVRVQPRTGEGNNNWRGDALASYSSMHSRLRVVVGRAKDFVCVDCGGSAEQWSYVYGCPDERIEEGSGPWCPHLECYSPRCFGCHGSFDAESRRRN